MALNEGQGGQKYSNCMKMSTSPSHSGDTIHAHCQMWTAGKVYSSHSKIQAFFNGHGRNLDDVLS